MALASVGAGCFWREKKRVSTPAESAPTAFIIKTPGSNTNLVIRPATSPVGRVASVNIPGKFVVLSFPVGHLPTNDTRLSIFHAGAKVGEVRVTGPASVQENLTVGDITAGTAEDGDEARSD